MGSRRRLADVATVAATLVEEDPDGSVLDHVGRLAATVIRGLGLAIDPTTSPISLSGPGIDLDPELLRPELVGLVYEQLIAIDERRQRGAHFTPPDVAAGLIEAATAGWGPCRDQLVEQGSGFVVDPSCGGGVFVLAAANWLLAQGLSPQAAVGRVAGIDVAPDAVAVSQLSLAMWFASRAAPGPATSSDRGDPATSSDRGDPATRSDRGDLATRSDRGDLATVHGTEDGSGAARGAKGRFDTAEGSGDDSGPAHGTEGDFGAAGLVKVDQIGQFWVGDALKLAWPEAALVVGNPPFLSQLNTPTTFGAEARAELRDRFGDALGPYTDPAWLFLLAAVDAAVGGGRVMLIQPTSLLSARDGTLVRKRLAESCDLVGLWLANERIFAASVDVWAPILETGGGVGTPAPPTALWTGRHVESVPPKPPTAPVEGETNAWTSLCADIVGVPMITWPRSARTIGDVATVTAGFRDQFYGFVPFTSERTPAQSDAFAFPRLVTAGMIDPLRLRWGTKTFRYAGSTVSQPVVDRAALGAGDRVLAAWLDERLRPKLLMATQTRVLEVIVDIDGTLVPVTPCLSIEPRSADPDLLWELAAALSSPALTVIAKRASMGAAMSADAIKVSARAVASLPMPSSSGSGLERGAAAVRDAVGASTENDWVDALDRMADAMADAYDISVNRDTIVAWWRQRCPSWR